MYVIISPAGEPVGAADTYWDAEQQADDIGGTFQEIDDSEVYGPPLEKEASPEPAKTTRDAATSDQASDMLDDDTTAKPQPEPRPASDNSPKSDNEKMKNTIDGVIGRICGLGFEKSIAYDVLENKVYAVGALPWSEAAGDRPWKDVDDSNLMRLMQIGNPAVKKANVLDGLVLVANQNRFNPIVKMLESLPPWDGRERAAGLLEVMLGARPSEYERQVMLLFMREAIARAYAPGMKCDYTPVLLSGAEGIGKSSFVGMLAVQDRFYLDNLTTIKDKKVAGEEMVGKWICELAEMTPLRAAGPDLSNAFLTRRIDSFREAYGRVVTDHPRSCVFIATANDAEAIDGIGDARRFLPVVVGETNALPLVNPAGDTLEWARAYIEQAWAEMLSAYIDAKDEGMPWPLVLPAGVRDEAAAAMEEIRPLDSRIEAIRDYLDDQAGVPDPRHRRQTVITIMCGAMQMDRDRALADAKTQAFVRKVLTRRAPGWGWTRQKARQRVDGYAGPVYCWDVAKE